HVPPTGSRPPSVLPSTPPGENQAVESAEQGPKRATGPPAVALALEKAGGPAAAGLPIPRRSLDPPFRATPPSNPARRADRSPSWPGTNLPLRRSPPCVRWSPGDPKPGTLGGEPA